MYQKTKRIRLKGVRLKALKKRVLERDNYACVYCGSMNNIDLPHHIVFKSHGGSDEMENMVTLCREHHSWIHDKGCLRIEIVDNSNPYDLKLRFIEGFKKT